MGKTRVLVRKATLASFSPYLALATGIIVPALFWARTVTEKLNSIKDNHLAHIEAHTAKTNDLLIEIRTILRGNKE
jgi:hypothetical protein